jgi:hypothetical protein
MNISVFRNSLGQAGYFSTDPRAVRERCENGARTAFDGLDGRGTRGIFPWRNKKPTFSLSFPYQEPTSII